MPYQRLILVQPCYSLEDLPRNLNAETASDYHACWTALWHPSILASTGALPEWKRSDASSLDVKNSLIVVPAASQTHLDSTLRERIDLGDNFVLSSSGARNQIVSAIAAELGVDLVEHSLEPVCLVPPDMAQDIPPRSKTTSRSFYALGFAYQQLHILTRKVHYSTNLDEALFQEQLLLAARAFIDQNADETERWLQSCYDQLSQERDRYFSQPANLIDLTLLAPSTLGNSLRQQLATPSPANFLASGYLLETLSQHDSELLELLKEALQSGHASLVGGLEREGAFPWLGQRSLLRELGRGYKSYRALGVALPVAFSRLSGGVRPNDSQFYRIAGHQHAVLNSWVDGGLPRSDQAKIRWQSADGTMIDAISSFISDASSPLHVLSAAVDLSKQFDYHQVPTLVFAHWPAQYCEAFEDLRLATERTAALGRWMTLGRYFEETGQAYSNTVLPASQFKYPIPTERSQYIEFCRVLNAIRLRLGLAESVASFAHLLQQLQRWTRLKSAEETVDEATSRATTCLSKYDALAASRCNDFVSTIATSITGWADASNALSVADPDLLKSISVLGCAGGRVLSGKKSAGEQSAFLLAEDNWLPEMPELSTSLKLGAKKVTIFNPSPLARRYWLNTGDQVLHSNEEHRVYATASNNHGHECIVDVPAMGVAQFECRAAELSIAAVRQNTIAPVATSLTNEFLDVQLDAKSGMIRSLLVTRKRGNRMSGQLSIADAGALVRGEQMAGTSASKVYAEPRDVTLVVDHSSPLCGRVIARGTLCTGSTTLAEFSIVYELWRGSRCLQITPEVEWKIDAPENSGASQFWAGAPVWRSAWPNEAATLRTWPQLIPTKVTTATIFSPDVVEIDDAEHKLSLMFGGSNVHARQDSRYLDTHLGSGSKVRILVGIDVPNSLQMHANWYQRPLIFGDLPELPENQNSATFVTTSRRDVLVQWMGAAEFQSSIEENAEESSGNCDGFLWLQETSGKSGSLRLHFFRDVSSAKLVNLLGERLDDAKIENGDVLVQLKSCETMLLKVTFAKN